MVESAQQQLRGFLLRLKRMGIGHEALETAARIGWVARGLLYFILGGLATLAAVGEGGGLHDGKGVLRWVISFPAGSVLVGLAGFGFAGYVLYCAALLCFGQEQCDSALASALARAKGAIGCVVYGSLTLTSVQLLLGHDEHGDSKRIWLAALFARPWGRVLICGLAIGLLGFAVQQCVYAASAKHRDEVSAGSMGTLEQGAFLWIGRVGLIARALVFAVIGYFTLRAAIEAAPRSPSTSTVEALREIRQVGWVPLAVVALGLVAYGLLQLFYAKYRKLDIA